MWKNGLTRAIPYCAVVVTVGALCSAPVRSQPPASEQPAPAESAQEDSVKEVEPRVFYLLDEKGNPIWVPNFSFEQWQRWFELDQRLRDPETPPFVHEKTTVEARVVGEIASVSVALQVRLVAAAEPQTDDWIRVPLGLSQGALQDLPSYLGTGEQFVTRSTSDGQLVAWVRAAPASSHLWKFDLRVPVIRNANDSQLRLEVPTSLAFVAKVRVPGSRVSGSVEGGASVLRAHRQVDGDTEFLLEGRSGLSISWRASGSSQEPVPARFDVRSRIRVTVEGPDYLTSRADLTVRSFSGEYRSFLVRLPPRMRLLSHSDQRGYVIEPVASDQAPDKDFQYVRVSLENKPPEAGLNFWLLAVLQRDREDSETGSEAIDMAGFHVLESVRQRGQIDFVVNGDWTLNWQHGRAVRRVNPRPDADSATPLVAQFLYHQYPYQLALTVREKTRDVRVEPELELDVQPERLEFQELLVYQVRGARTSELTIDVGEWMIDKVGPEEVVAEYQHAVGQLRIQLTAAAVDFDQFTIRLNGHQPMPTESSLAVELPLPLERTVSPTKVSVRTARNVELIPITEKMVGLVPLASSVVSNSGPEREWVFRQDTSASAMRFAADFKIRERQITINLGTVVGVESGQLRVQRQAEYQVTFGSLTEVTLELPRSILENASSRFQIRADGEKLPTPLAETTLPGDDENVQVDVLLPREVVDRVQIVLEYEVPLAALSANRQVDVTVPIARPVATEGASLSLVASFLRCADSLDVRVPGAELVVASRSSPEGIREFELPLTETAEKPLALEIRRVETGRSIPIIVKQTWIQTWATGDHYWNRMSVRVETRQSRIQIVFPVGSQLGPVAVNQQPIHKPSMETGDRLDLPLDPVVSEHVLELWYSLPRVSGRSWRRVVAPRIDGVSRFGRSYWQLVTPPNQHLTWSSNSLSEESHWRWTGWGWRREELRDQQALERWIGASEQDALPVDTNRYLFATVGAVRHLDYVTFSRHLLLLLGSG